MRLRSAVPSSREEIGVISVADTVEHSAYESGMQVQGETQIFA